MVSNYFQLSIETSSVTRTALTVAQEGAIGIRLLAHDVCDPSLVFGEGA
jgi:hypothetical protein